MVVCLKTFCTLFHWEVSKEHCCRCEEYTAYDRAKCIDELHAALHEPLVFLITASFVHFEQSWEGMHTQPPSHKQEQRVHKSAAAAEATLLWGLTTGFYAVQYWYCQWFYNYQGGYNGCSKHCIRKCDGDPVHYLKEFEGRHNSNHW